MGSDLGTQVKDSTWEQKSLISRCARKRLPLSFVATSLIVIPKRKRMQRAACAEACRLSAR